MPDRSETEQLRAAQARRVDREREQAAQAIDDEERQAHERRAEKATYLRDKLGEQAKAPDE
jgi:hypothetical protein